MTPSPPPVSLLSPRPAASTLLLVLLASSAAAEVRLDVAGHVREEEGLLVVRVDLTNHGTTAARAVQVQGELLRARSEAALPGTLDAGATRAVELRLAVEAPRPGVYGLGLQLLYVPDGAEAGAEADSQRAYLLLALGANPAPSVRLSVPHARVARHTVVPVRLQSADGAAHRVRLRALAPRGLNALPPEEPVDVPAAGAATAPLRVIRAGAPPGSRAGIVVLAAEVDGPLERTAVATGRVEVVAPPAPWLPRVRVPLLVTALALLAAAVIVELWSFRSRPGDPRRP
jgi:hypothetical protein